MLTLDDLKILQAAFKPNEHDFLKGNAYITEGAITRRIEQVDPSWKLEQINLFNRANSKQVICTVRLTINDTWRDGVGMAVITMTKQGDNEANEAEKAAATDAFKRAARLFGIGRYLLDLPSSVVDVPSIAKWLGESVGIPTQQQPPQPPAQPSLAQQPQQPASAAPAQAENGANGAPDANTATWWNEPIGTGATWKHARDFLKRTAYIGEHDAAITNSIKKHAAETNNWQGMTAGQVVTYLNDNHKQPTLSEAS